MYHSLRVARVPHQDRWIDDEYMKIVGERKRHEMNETLREAGIDENGNEGEITVRFWNKDTEDPGDGTITVTEDRFLSPFSLG